MAEATDILSQIRNIWSNLGGGQKAGAIAVTVLVFGGVLAASLLGGKTEYRQIAAGLTPAEVSSLVTQLENEGFTDYKILADGSTVLVSTEQIDQARNALSRSGSLPTGKTAEESTGLFGNTAMNSREVSLANARRQEKRLATILAGFDYVEFANVTITPAVDKYWKKGDKPAKASVVVKPRMALSEHQIQSIAHTIASGVENLRADDVAISDTNGIVLRAPMAGGMGGGLARSLQTQAEMEAQREMAVQGMLDLAFGAHKVLVTVSLELDWTKQNVRQKTYDPESKVTRHRSKTETSKSRASRVPGGRPGSTDTINTSESNLPSGSADTSSTTEEMADYGSTESESVRLGGEIKRMGVGVVLDQSLADKRDEIADMIKASVNFDQERNDTLQVTVTEIAGPGETENLDELMAEAESRDQIMVYAEFGLYSLLGIAFLFFTLRTIKKAKKSLHEVLETSLVEESEAIEPPQPKSLEETVLEAVQKDSELAGKSLRRWLYEGAAE